MTFLQEIETFLFTLRNEYGFLLPAETIRRCLTCAADVTDLEEVFYRMQSLVCSCEEQIDLYRSRFGQTFLGLFPSELPSLQNSEHAKKEPLAPSEEERTQREEKRLQQQLIVQEKNIQYIETQVESARHFQQNIQLQMEQSKEEIQELVASAPVSEETQRIVRTGASPDLSNETLQVSMRQVQKALERLAAYRENTAGQPETLSWPDIEQALCSPKFKSELEHFISKAMHLASDARSKKDAPQFKDCLALVAALKKLQEAAGKSISSQAKQAFQKMEKDFVAYFTELEQKQAGIGELKEKIGHLEQRIEQFHQQIQSGKVSAETIQRKLEDLAQKKSACESQSQTGSEEIIVKPEAVTHRAIFTDGIHAVQTVKQQAELLETSLTKMKEEERKQILAYIRSNAQAFRQTLRRKSSIPRHRQVDVKATMRAAVRTGGELVLVKYKEPKKSHAKLVMLTDLSGSCAKASTLALYFMAMMDTVFPGGCRKFAFVNTLIPIDKYFRECSADEGVQAVMRNIPTRGAYSDYGVPLHTLRTEYAGSFHQDTTMIILGDARNNQRASHSEDLKYLADRSHKVFWLNTDPVEKWNRGDSIIREYERSGAEVHHVETVQDLLEFLTNLSPTTCRFAAWEDG